MPNTALRNPGYRQGLSNNTLFFLESLPSSGPKRYGAYVHKRYTLTNMTTGEQIKVLKFAHTSEPAL